MREKSLRPVKYEGLVVNGSSEPAAVREAIAGLRLLRLYGRAADRALQDVRRGRVPGCQIPHVVRHSLSMHDYYELSTAAMHYKAPIGRVPGLSLLQVSLSAERGIASRGSKPFFAIGLSGEGILLWGGRSRSFTINTVVDSVWGTKSGLRWSFKEDACAKSSKSSVLEALVRPVVSALVKVRAGGKSDVASSMATQMGESIRKECGRLLVAEGHVERLRVQAIGLFNVEAVHTR